MLNVGELRKQLEELDPNYPVVMVTSECIECGHVNTEYSPLLFSLFQKYMLMMIMTIYFMKNQPT